MYEHVEFQNFLRGLYPRTPAKGGGEGGVEEGKTEESVGRERKDRG